MSVKNNDPLDGKCGAGDSKNPPTKRKRGGTEEYLASCQETVDKQTVGSDREYLPTRKKGVRSDGSAGKGVHKAE